MKKIILSLFASIILFSCETKQEIYNKHSKDILISSFESINKTRILIQTWDTTLNNLKLTPSEEMDTVYIKRCNDYESIKSKIYNLINQKFPTFVI